jgi:hypothetical protein
VMQKTRSPVYCLNKGPDDLRIVFRFPERATNIIFSEMTNWSLKHTQPPVQRLMTAVSSGLKRPGRESNHLPPSTSKLTNAWSYTYTTILLHYGVHTDSYTSPVPSQQVHVLTILGVKTAYELCGIKSVRCKNIIIHCTTEQFKTRPNTLSSCLDFYVLSILVYPVDLPLHPRSRVVGRLALSFRSQETNSSASEVTN